MSHQAREITLAGPVTLPVEIANSLHYATPTVDDALALLNDFDDAHVHLFDVTAERLQAATRRAAEVGIGVFDALFLTLAEELECPLVTADHKAFANATTPIEIRLLKA